MSQFRVLYREFLFRVVDPELLSPHAEGDASKILGQFAALLVLFGSLFSLGLLSSGDPHKPREAMLIAAWGTEHFLIATTMLVVGLFAVLSWDATFPDRRDLLALAPLPVATRTLFLAKVAASATALAATVLALNGLTIFAWTMATAAPASDSNLDLIFSPAVYRSFAAYAITMISAGWLVFASMLCAQGLAALLLPRRRFLRVSGLLQISFFCLLVSVYFLQPTLATPKDLAEPRNQSVLACLPSYWFLGLLQQLNGSMRPELAPLAKRAWIGLLWTGLGASVVYVLSYHRTLKKIVEEPDIVPIRRNGVWLPKFGDAFETAVTQFSLRTLLRSRRHRLMRAFYFGVGFAVTILFLRTPAAQRQLMTRSLSEPVSGAVLASSIVLTGAWIVGTSVVFSIPMDLGANWIFRITPNGGAPAGLAARRRALTVMSLAPASAGSAALFLSIWPWRPAIIHWMILALLGMILTELCLRGTQKIPFACSYLPGRSNFHLTFWLCTGLMMTLISKGAEFERQALGHPARSSGIVCVLIGTLILARWRNSSAVRQEGAELRFEEETPPVIMSLELRTRPGQAGAPGRCSGI